jgi:VanZ family protein
MLWGSSLIPGNDPPSMPSVLGWDKLQHVAAFMFLAALVVRALSMTPWPQAHRRWAALTMAICLTVGGVQEWLQEFGGGRTPSGWDVLADLVGAAILLAILAVGRKLAADNLEPEETRWEKQSESIPLGEFMEEYGDLIPEIEKPESKPSQPTKTEK